MRLHSRRRRSGGSTACCDVLSATASILHLTFTLFYAAVSHETQQMGHCLLLCIIMHLPCCSCCAIRRALRRCRQARIRRLPACACFKALLLMAALLPVLDLQQKEGEA